MTPQELRHRVQILADSRPLHGLTRKIDDLIKEAKQVWLEEERATILRLIDAWIGDTVEGRDLRDSILMRNKRR